MSTRAQPDQPRGRLTLLGAAGSWRTRLVVIVAAAAAVVALGGGRSPAAASGVTFVGASGSVLGAAVRSVTVNGPAASLKVTRVGQRVERTFTAGAGRRVSVVVNHVVNSLNTCGTTLTLFDPSGAPVGQPATDCGNNSVAVGPVTLTMTGTYRVRFELNPQSTGQGTLWVSAPVHAGTVTVNGPAAPMKVTRVGQPVERTFTAGAGRRVSVVVNNVVNSLNTCGTTLTLFGPSGAPVGQPATDCGNNSVAVGPVTLNMTGTYRVRFELNPQSTGQGTLTVSTP